ncbi:hypothetical protein ACT3N0_28020 (plasmid) [Citrobacter portucalensis]|uniref:hypothetical protein n=1 Tax=Citrobacter portucalensis TaxID=1639133 RepID=UPI004034A96F
MFEEQRFLAGEKQFCKRWYIDMSSFGINPGKTPGNKRNIPDVTYFHFCQQHPPPTPENKKAACSIGKPYIKGNYVLRFVLNRDALLLRITNQIIHGL